MKGWSEYILLNDFTCCETRLHNADWFDCIIALGSIQRYAIYPALHIILQKQILFAMRKKTKKIAGYVRFMGIPYGVLL